METSSRPATAVSEKLLEAGVCNKVRVPDARLSETAFGPPAAPARGSRGLLPRGHDGRGIVFDTAVLRGASDAVVVRGLR